MERAGGPELFEDVQTFNVQQYQNRRKKSMSLNHQKQQNTRGSFFYSTLRYITNFRCDHSDPAVGCCVVFSIALPQGEPERH